MRKRLLLIVFVLLFALASCDGETDNPTKTPSGNDTEQVDDNNKTDDEQKDDETSNEETPQDTYVKDGDVIHYFELFGTESDCTEDWGFGETATCYDIEITSEGMDITMRYYKVEDTYYKTFDFYAKKGTATLVIQMEYQVRADTTVSFSDSGQYIKGFLTFNGLDQNPVFELNKNYQYEDWQNGSEDAMQTLLNSLIVAVDNYYKLNIDANIVTTP